MKNYQKRVRLWKKEVAASPQRILLEFEIRMAVEAAAWKASVMNTKEVTA